MSNSMVSIIFLGVLGLLFLLLIILTLVLIFTKKKDTDEDYEEDYDDTAYDEDYGASSYEENEASYGEYEDNASEDINEEDVESQAEDYDDNDSDNADEDDIFNEAYKEASYDEDISDTDDEADGGIDEKTVEETVQNDNEAEESKSTENSASDTEVEEADDELDLDSLLDEISENKEEAGTQTADEAVSDVTEQTSTEEQSPSEETSDVEQPVDEIPAVFADELGDYSDSAFAPVYEDDKLSDEALIASVKEAQALSENVMHSTSNNNSEVLFGVGDELDKYKKKTPKKSTVSSDEDFYWYNKMDVMEKPSYKTAEMYYHYFNLPKDCIDDLLVEMYDCALVRTEEIRYIAYGIKPKAVSLKDIMQEGNYYYTDQPKQKEPLPQDLIRIYEKWCGYVDKLFDKIEIHADEYTIQEIRKILCEYGRNDVDVLLEGR